MGASDEFARQRDVDRVERAVEQLRTQVADGERRHAELREADNARHAAEHDTIEARIDAARERHEAEHKAEEQARVQTAQQLRQRKDRVWTKAVALAAAAAGVVSAWVALLVYLHGR